MKKRIGWLFTGVGLVGLLPALYGILIMGCALNEGNDRMASQHLKESVAPFFILLLLVAGLVLWTGNIRYSFGRIAWWGNRTFWKISGIYNFMGALFVVILCVVFREPAVLFWAPYPVLAGVLSLYVSHRETEGVFE